MEKNNVIEVTIFCINNSMFNAPKSKKAKKINYCLVIRVFFWYFGGTQAQAQNGIVSGRDFKTCLYRKV